MTGNITLPRSVVEQALEALNASMPHNNDMDHDWPSHIAARRALRAALEQPQDHTAQHLDMVPEGWALVPVEPTAGMVLAGERALKQHDFLRLDASYRAMLAAAPQPPVVEQPQSVTNCHQSQPQGEQEPAVDDRQLYIGACITEGRLYANVMRTEPSGSVTVIAMANMDASSLTNNDCISRMLPAQQPKRQPLTDELIDKIADGMPGGLDGFMKGWGWRQFARAVEAHGIGGEA